MNEEVEGVSGKKGGGGRGWMRRMRVGRGRGWMRRIKRVDEDLEGG